MKRLALLAAALMLPASVNAASITADLVLDFVDSGAGPIAGPYGGTFVPASYPEAVPLSYATDGDSNTFVSLPIGSSLTLGFSEGFIFDAPGQDDLFIDEPGDGAENADVFVSTDLGATFTYLGEAFGASTTSFDFADYAFTGNVNAVRIVGLDNGGGSPGFDLAFVRGEEGSVVIEPQLPTIPVPAAGLLLLPALGALSVVARRRKG
ncbi:VPLPA-CTERM sorting domain-containing protein [Meridianimarinicoccus sp. RP-17]|uniref:VPLPA-CTERM sorting domain-containing protein n=1 Tax=Meridianimarinicoccus zhengii TaxID=2056810 RepID=UPI0013A6D5B2|nr:VPLPA-CTERM sorting domain-containing protein [Phycocomes zhengii]